MIGARAGRTGAPPALGLGLDRTVPGWGVRAAPAVLVLATAALTGGGRAVWLAAAGAGVLLVGWPRWPVAPAVLVGLGVLLLREPDLLGAQGAGGVLRASGLVLVVHLLLRAAGLATHVALAGRVEVRVLRRVLLSVLTQQLLVQALLVAVAVVRSAVGVPGVEALRVVAVVAVLAVVGVAVPMAWVRRGGRPG